MTYPYTTAKPQFTKTLKFDNFGQLNIFRPEFKLPRTILNFQDRLVLGRSIHFFKSFLQPSLPSRLPATQKFSCQLLDAQNPVQLHPCPLPFSDLTPPLNKIFTWTSKSRLRPPKKFSSEPPSSLPLSFPLHHLYLL